MPITEDKVREVPLGHGNLSELQITSELVKKHLKAIGLSPKQYGLHSLRSGGAFAAAAAAISDRLLMRHGG